MLEKILKYKVFSPLFSRRTKYFFPLIAALAVVGGFLFWGASQAGAIPSSGPSTPILSCNAGYDDQCYGTSTVTLSARWEESSDPDYDIAYYKVGYVSADLDCSAVDNWMQVSSTTLNFEFAGVFSEAETYYLCVKAYNTIDGESGIGVSDPVAIDVSPPLTAVSAIDITGEEYVFGNWAAGDVSVNLSANDGVSDVYKVYYCLGEDCSVGIYSEYAEEILFISESVSETAFNYYSVDNAGNIEPPLAEDLVIKIDIEYPTILDVTSSNPDGTYYEGEEINLVYTFSEAVTIALDPLIGIDLNGDIGTADLVYIDGSGTDTVTFRYVIAAGHESDRLDYPVGGAFSLTSESGGQAITDRAGNEAEQDLPYVDELGALGANKNLRIIGSPRPVPPDDTPPAGNGGIVNITNSCARVEYGAWSDCLNGWKFRSIVSSSPSFCQPTSAQTAGGTERCGVKAKNDNENEDDSNSNSDSEQLNNGNGSQADVGDANGQVKGVKLYGPGTLLRGADQKIYIVGDLPLKRIFTLAELRQHGGEAIYDVNDEVLVAHGLDNVLLRFPDGKIFLRLNGKLIYIPNLTELAKYAGKRIFAVE